MTNLFFWEWYYEESLFLLSFSFFPPLILLLCIYAFIVKINHNKALRKESIPPPQGVVGLWVGSQGRCQYQIRIQVDNLKVFLLYLKHFMQSMSSTDAKCCRRLKVCWVVWTGLDFGNLWNFYLQREAEEKRTGNVRGCRNSPAIEFTIHSPRNNKLALLCVRDFSLFRNLKTHLKISHSMIILAIIFMGWGICSWFLALQGNIVKLKKLNVDRWLEIVSVTFMQPNIVQ